jgi:hypothetical protein
VTADRTIPQLKRFMEEGGTVITIGSSTNLAGHLGLPVADYMVERMPNGTERPLPQDKFYVPGSLLRVTVDNTLPVTTGLPRQVDVFFDDSPVFRLEPDAASKGVKPLAWFDTDKPLRSGWAWGQNYLQGGTAMAQADVGAGKLYLFGPEILFRGQPHGTFKLLFNGIFAGLVDRPMGRCSRYRIRSQRSEGGEAQASPPCLLAPNGGRESPDAASGKFLHLSAWPVGEICPRIAAGGQAQAVLGEKVNTRWRCRVTRACFTGLNVRFHDSRFTIHDSRVS